MPSFGKHKNSWKLVGFHEFFITSIFPYLRSTPSAFKALTFDGIQLVSERPPQIAMSDPGMEKGSEPELSTTPDASVILGHTEEFVLADTIAPQTSAPDISIPQHGVLLQNPGHHITDQLPHSQESSLSVAASPPNHQCRQLCHLLGCLATAPWTQQVQNVQDGRICAPELQVLFSETSCGLRRVLFAASVAFEGEDRGRCGFLNFKQFLDALQSLCVDMPYHHRLSLFMNSDADQDGWITRNEFSTAYLRILFFSSNSCH